MPGGPGKYDDLCTHVREITECKTAIVMVVDGILGSGFSVQPITDIPPHAVANMLERIAKELRDSWKANT